MIQLEKIIVTSNFFDTKGPRELSSEIIQKLTVNEKFVLVGIGSIIPLVLSAVNLSRNIANVNIHTVTLDYISIPFFGKQEVIFIELGHKEKEPSQNVVEFESLDETIKNYRTIWVPRKQDIARITDEILFKLSKNDKVRIMASGFAIFLTIKSVLQVVKTDISKEVLGVSDVIIDSLGRKNDPLKMVPSINIYISKGEIKRPKFIEKVLKEIKQEILKE